MDVGLSRLRFLCSCLLDVRSYRFSALGMADNLLSQFPLLLLFRMILPMIVPNFVRIIFNVSGDMPMAIYRF